VKIQCLEKTIKSKVLDINLIINDINMTLMCIIVLHLIMICIIPQFQPWCFLIALKCNDTK